MSEKKYNPVYLRILNIWNLDEKLDTVGPKYYLFSIKVLLPLPHPNEGLEAYKYLKSVPINFGLNMLKEHYFLKGGRNFLKIDSDSFNDRANI